MAKKVKCIECANSCFFSLPCRVTSNNYDYAKHCLAVAKRSIYCGQVNKTKPREHEQYCKHFFKEEFSYSIDDEIARLEKMIEEYEIAESMKGEKE